jgi:hypothetical protein
MTCGARKRRYVKLLLAGVALIFGGCVSDNRARTGRSSSTAPPPDVAIRAGLPETEAQQARKLYVLKCAKCHAFYDPAQYTETEWSTWMSKMSRKAHLTREETEALDKYLRAFR